MLDVRRLRLLRELSLRGTIASVADALAFTPSAVSQQLAVLEREAGSALLERTGRRVALTPAGLALVSHAEAILERLERATAELAGNREGLAGPVRLGVFPTASRTLVPGALTALLRAHPQVEPRLREIDPAGVAAALRAGDLDAALVHVYDFVPEVGEPGVESTELFDEPLYLATAAPYDDADGGRADAGEARAEGEDAGRGARVLHAWRNAPWITATPGTLCHAMTVRACQAAGFVPCVRHEVDDFATVLALVAAGQGVAVVPHLAVGEPPPEVRLMPLPLRRHTRIAFRAGAGGHPALRAVVAALRAARPAHRAS